MTAYELADRLDRNVWGGVHPDIKKCSDMLRQQADRIAELEAENAKIKTKLIGKALVKALDGFTEKSKPVAWIDKDGEIFKAGQHPDYYESKCNPLYTHPYKQLSDEEIEEWLDVYGLDMGDVYEINKVRFVQAVRAIIKEITE